jgi:Fe2+ or Zn2+ uptake regulation protein
MKQTKHRAAILDLLKKNRTTYTAQQIRERLPHINLVTIYRNLDNFVTLGLIKKFNLDSNEAVFEFQDHPHHHAICTDCHQIRHFDIDTKKLKSVLAIKDFDVTEVEIIVRGNCTNLPKK